MAKTKHVLKVTARTANKSADARRLRKTGMIPAVVYGSGKDAKSVAVNARDWEVLTRNELSLITLEDEGVETLVLLKAVQHDFMRNCASHIDFLAVDTDKKITATIPLHPGHTAAKGVSAGGIFEQNIHEIEVECFPNDLPEYIEADVSGMTVGSAMHIADIALPANVKVITHGELVAFHVADPNGISADLAPAGAEDEEAAQPELIKKPAKEEDAE